MLLQVATQQQGGETSLQIQQHNHEIDPILLRAALYLCDQRTRGQVKFGPQSDTLYFDDDGLQMASSLPVARHRAQRFGEECVIDLCCGVGGDLLALAERGPSIGIDIDPARLHMATANMQSAAAPVQLVLGDAARPPVRGAAAIADPARRRAGRRTRSGNDYEPSLSHLEAWRQQFHQLAVKVSPALALSEVPSRQEVEYVSWQGQCREAVLWFGSPVVCRRRATLIADEIHTVSSPHDEIRRPEVQPAGRFLYDPDPALVRSHLVGELAQVMGAWLIADEVAYLSTQAPVATPWARAFEVLQQVPFQLKSLQRLLRHNAWRPGSIRRRHFPIEPETLRRQLGRFAADAQYVELICTRIEGKTTVFICAPVV